jgi:hypothetical protein
MSSNVIAAEGDTAYKIGSYAFRRLSQHKVIHILYKGIAPNLQGFYRALPKLRNISVAGMSSVAIGD